MRDLSALFDPVGVIIAGASAHPGKFGFVALHNLLTAGYAGPVFATNLDQEPVLGIDTVASVDDLPSGQADLIVVCTPGPTVPGILRQAAAKGVRAAFVTSAGFGEAGGDGPARDSELVVLADALGMVLAGPNAQGVVSTPSELCAQIVAPYPPPGGIGVVSQSGNLVSTFLNLARESGVGVSRAVSAGNAAMLDVGDYLEWYGADDATGVCLAYVEGVRDGRRFMQSVAAAAAVKPVVIVKGGASLEGQRAASSHTGSLASDDRIFTGALRQAGAVRARGNRGGIRRRCSVRHAAPAAGKPRRRGHDGGRLGRSDRRRRVGNVLWSSPPCPTISSPPSVNECRPAGAATTRSISPAAKHATPCRRYSTSSPVIPTSMPSSSSESESSRTRLD